MFIEWRNTTKVFSKFDNIFHLYLMRKLQQYTLAKICKEFDFLNGFLRADQDRAKKCCWMAWIGSGCAILQIAQKTNVWLHFVHFLQSLINIILCWSIVQQNMRVTRRIVLTLLTKALYEFGCFKEKVWSFLKFWIWQRCYFTVLP